MQEVLLIALGGTAGAVSRHLISTHHAATHPLPFSLGTLVVNIVGCFLAGCILGWFNGQAEAIPSNIRHLLVVGFLGGLTTFSAFSLDVVLQATNGAVLRAAVVAGANVIGSLVAVVFGLQLMVKLRGN